MLMYASILPCDPGPVEGVDDTNRTGGAQFSVARNGRGRSGRARGRQADSRVVINGKTFASRTFSPTRQPAMPMYKPETSSHTGMASPQPRRDVNRRVITH